MESTKAYNDIIREYPLLTKEQETEYIRIYKREPDRRDFAEDMLIKSNIRLVLDCAKRFANRGIEHADLVQEGLRGLMYTLERFDETREIKLSTYATYWIRQFMNRYAKKYSRTVSVPEHVINNMSRIARFERDYTAETGKTPTESETAKAVGVDVDTVRHAKRSTAAMVSMQARIGDDGREFGDTLRADAPGAVPDENAMDGIRHAASGLTDRERAVIDLRYGVSCGGMSVRDVAKTFSVDESRVAAALEGETRRFGAA